MAVRVHDKGDAVSPVLAGRHKEPFLGGRPVSTSSGPNEDIALGTILVPIGDGCDGTAFDAGTMTAFTSNGDGTLTVVKEKSPREFVVLENAATQKGARTIAIDENSHLVYLPTANFMEPAANEPKPKRPTMVPGTFRVLVVGK